MDHFHFPIAVVLILSFAVVVGLLLRPLRRAPSLRHAADAYLTRVEQRHRGVIKSHCS